MMAIKRSTIHFFAIIISTFVLLPVAAGQERDPESLFNEYCFSCHGTGWEGAPVMGDNFAWKDRISKGMAVLLENTKNGINAMPPQGTCSDCTEQELKNVIEFLIAE